MKKVSNYPSDTLVLFLRSSHEEAKFVPSDSFLFSSLRKGFPSQRSSFLYKRNNALSGTVASVPLIQAA